MSAKFASGEVVCWHHAQPFSQTDEALVANFVSGEIAAFNDLVKRYKKRIYTFIYLQINHQQDAEDLTQDVFIQLYQKAQNFRNDSQFSSFLYTIAKHLVFNYFRTKSRRISHLDSSSNANSRHVELCSTMDGGSIHAIDEFQNGADIATDNATNSAIRNQQSNIVSAMNSLKVEERQLIVLADKNNFTYEQLSHILDINIGTVRSRLSNIRKKLIKLLRDQKNEL